MYKNKNLKHDEKFKYEAVHLSLKVCEILFLYEAPFLNCACYPSIEIEYFQK